MPTMGVRTQADMKGLKIRVQTSPVMAEVMQALGAMPVPIPYAQVRERLAAGTIDAAENNIISYHASRHHEVAKVYSLTEHVARRRRGVLQAGVGSAARRGSRDRPPGRRGIWCRISASSSMSRRPPRAARSPREGVQFVTDVDKAAFVRLLIPLYPKLVTAPRHRDLIDQVRASE